MGKREYVHGYDERERQRLHDQANTLAELLHDGTRYAPGSLVLEAGCGVGAQTIHLCRNSPQARFVSVDISADSLARAAEMARRQGLKNVTFQQADVYGLPFSPGSFDHVFACFLLEHLPDPVGAVRCLCRVLKRGGTLTIIEGDHGSAYFYPDSEAAHRAIQCLVDLQARGGGDALIGRRLYQLLREAGCEDITVRPREVYADGSRPRWVEGFTRNTFTAMVQGVREAAVAAGMLSGGEFDRGIADLYRTAEDDGTFCYTFFKAIVRMF